jgi:molybdopterin converting factor small subunit
MLVKFFGPFEKLAEREVRIVLDEPISTKEMLQMLASRYPGLARYSMQKNDVELSAHVMLIRDGTPLKLADKIEDEDCIDILLPVAGG